MAEDMIQVAVRLRPIIQREKKSKQMSQWTVDGNAIFLNEDLHFREKPDTFTFDYILDTNSNNEDVYEIVQPLVSSTLTGFNATIFAYGQTSSGKTHSILGSENDPGIIPRSANSIFAEIHKHSRINKYVVKLSYIEIYNEKIIDLLDLKNVDMKFNVAEDRKSSVLVGMHEEIIHNEEELMDVIGRGNKNRQVGETKMNERSSRSHVICDIFIECSALEECCNGEIDTDTPVKAGHLYIVDLAGSERVAQTGATGARLNEGVHINKSLSALISVITALSTGQSYVNYRDSKLTRYLNTALGGNSRTLMVAAITPVSVEDSLSTLKFARSAKTIKTKPRLNELVSQQSQIKRQQEEARILEARINALEAELIQSRSIYVQGVKPKKTKRRHTMAASNNIAKMEQVPEHVPQEDDTKSVYQEIEPRSSEELNEVVKRLSELPLLTTHSCDGKEDIYQDLMTQFNLDQSHVPLEGTPRLTQLEFDMLQEETKELKLKLDALKSERDGFEEEVKHLKKSNNIAIMGIGSPEHVPQEDDAIFVDQEIEPRLSEEFKEVVKRLSELPLLTTHSCDCKEDKHQNLMTQFNLLDQSHASLKGTPRLTLLEFDIMLQEETKELKKKLHTLKSERDGFEEEVKHLKKLNNIAIIRIGSPEHVSQDDDAKFVDQEIEPRRSEECKDADKRSSELPLLTTHSCDCKEDNYQDLVTKFNLLDQSHMSLKEFTRLEFDIMLQEETKELTQKLDALKLERDRFEEEVKHLKNNYEVLDISHVDLQEFTKIEENVVVEERERNLKLKQEYDKLKERYDIMECEQEFLKKSQNKLQRRCSEQLARIEDLKNEKLPNNAGKLETIIETVEPVVGPIAEKENNVHMELQARCESLEADIKLIEMHSKILQHENNVLKARKKELTRSYSDTNLAALSENGVVDETTKEDFQSIYKSMRKLMSTIISDTDANDLILGSTPLRATGLTPLRRMLPSSDKQEENELRQENTMLKEHTHDLLMKLKTLNDKLNERGVPSSNVDVGALDEKYAKLLARNVELERHLHEQDVDDESKLKADYCHELEEKIKLLENDLKECESLSKSYQDAQSKVEELTKELIVYQNQNDNLPNQNSRFIEELQEKLKVGNELELEKEEQIKQLQDQLKALVQQSEEVTLLQKEHQELTASLKRLEASQLQTKTGGIEQIEELKQTLVLKEEELVKLRNEFKQMHHDHCMDKESLEYYTAEFDEAMAKIKELQTDIKKSKTNHEQYVSTLMKEVELYKEEKARYEVESVNIATVREEFAKVKECLLEKQTKLQESEDKLNLAVAELKVCQNKLELSNNEVCQVKTELKALQEKMDAVQTAKEQNKSKLAMVQTLLERKEQTMNELQRTHDEVIQEWERVRNTITSEKDDCKQEAMMREQEAFEHLSSLDTLRLDMNDIKSKLIANKERRAEMKALLIEKDRKIAELELALSEEGEKGDKISKLEHATLIEKLQLKLDAAKQECHQSKVAAAVATQSHQDEIYALQSIKEDLNGKITDLKRQLILAESPRLDQDEKLANFVETEAEKNRLVASLQEKLEITIQALENDKMAADEARKQQELEIKVKDMHCEELEQKMTELQRDIDSFKARESENKEKLSTFQSLLAEKDILMKKLQAEYDQERHNHKMALDLAQKHNEKITELETCIDSVKTSDVHNTEKLSTFQALLADKDDLLKKLEAECEQQRLDSKMVSDLAQKLRQHEDEVRQQLTLKVTELETYIVSIKAQDERHNEKLSTFQTLLTEKDDFLKKLEEQCEQERLNYKMESDSVQEGFEAKICALEQNLKKTTALQAENDALTQKLANYKIEHNNNQQQLEDALKNTEDNYSAAMEKIKQYEAEIFELRKNTENLGYTVELKQLDEKYQQAVVHINSLEAELEVTRKSHRKLKQIDITHKHVLARMVSMSDEEKVTFLEEEFHKKRIENSMNCDELAEVKRNYELLLKEKENWGQSKSSMNTKAMKIPPTNEVHVPAFALRKKKDPMINELEGKLADSFRDQKQAQETINTLNEKQRTALLTIQELKNDLDSMKNVAYKKTTETAQCDCAELRQKYEKLQLEYEQFIANNQENLKVEAKELGVLRSELQASQKVHERQIAAMTEDFERKYRAYSDKYSLLKKSMEEITRSKDATIKDLQARVEQSHKENSESPQVISSKLLSDANQLEMNANLKVKMTIDDLRKQVQAARNECARKTQQYERQVKMLDQDHQVKLTALQKKVFAKVPQFLDKSGTSASKTREHFARRFDSELSAIPVKLAALQKITSVETQPDACVMCMRRRRCLSTLRNNCIDHPVWRLLDQDISAAQMAFQGKVVRTERFDELTEVRNVYVQLLQHANSNEIRELITPRLESANRDISEYNKSLKEKETFLKFVQEELKTASNKITTEVSKDMKDACDQCTLFTLCCSVVSCLAESVSCSLVILEQLRSGMNPVQFVIDNAKGWKEKLAKMMANFEEQNNAKKELAEKVHFQEKYKRAKRLAEVRYKDVKQMEAVLIKDGYTVDFKANPIKIVKRTCSLPMMDDLNLDDDNPRPSIGRSRELGRKSLGATPKHFSPFFVTPDEHKEANNEARRHK